MFWLDVTDLRPLTNAELAAEHHRAWDQAQHIDCARVIALLRHRRGQPVSIMRTTGLSDEEFDYSTEADAQGVTIRQLLRR